MGNINVLTAALILLPLPFVVVNAVPEYKAIRKAREVVSISLARRRYLQVRAWFLLFINASTIGAIIAGSIVVLAAPPRSPSALAGPPLTVAAIVGVVLVVGKFALSAAIVPFLKAIPTALAGIMVKAGWDKWQTRKPREPKPQS